MTTPFRSLALATTLTLMAAGSPLRAEMIDLGPDTVTLIGGAVIEAQAGRTALALGRAEPGAPFGFGAAVLNGVVLENGTIEYDVMFAETRTFAGLMFRAQGPDDAEEFYMRAHQSGNPDATQYMPRFNGVPSWQLYYGPLYATPVAHVFDTWTHVRLEVMGDRADIYIGDMSAPALAVDLLRDPAVGGLSFWGLNLGGEAWFSNIDIAPDDSLELVGTPVPTEQAALGTVMSWTVSDAFDSATLTGHALPGGLPEASHTVSANANGITNLARLQGVSEGRDTVLAQVAVSSDVARPVTFTFGFSDDARGVPERCPAVFRF